MLKAKQLVVMAILLMLFADCHKTEVRKEKEEKPLQDINQVLQAHSAELLAKPEVVGFYVGQLEDGRACITVMLKSDNPEAKKQIPKSLEGHPVRIEVTGEFKPMR